MTLDRVTRFSNALDKLVEAHSALEALKLFLSGASGRDIDPDRVAGLLDLALSAIKTDLQTLELVRMDLVRDLGAGAKRNTQFEKEL